MTSKLVSDLCSVIRQSVCSSLLLLCSLLYFNVFDGEESVHFLFKLLLLFILELKFDLIIVKLFLKLLLFQLWLLSFSDS